MDKRRLPKHDLREIPTAAEIASRKAEVQSSWDDATERMRRTGTSTHQELQVPVVTVAEIVSGK